MKSSISQHQKTGSYPSWIHEDRFQVHNGAHNGVKHMHLHKYIQTELKFSLDLFFTISLKTCLLQGTNREKKQQKILKTTTIVNIDNFTYLFKCIDVAK